MPLDVRDDFAHVGAGVFGEPATASLNLDDVPAGLIPDGFGFAFVMPADGFAFLGFQPISQLAGGHVHERAEIARDSSPFVIAERHLIPSLRASRISCSLGGKPSR